MDAQVAEHQSRMPKQSRHRRLTKSKRQLKMTEEQSSQSKKARHGIGTDSEAEIIKKRLGTQKKSMKNQ